jgi:hypothetical protein
MKTIAKIRSIAPMYRVIPRESVIALPSFTARFCSAGIDNSNLSLF